MFRGNDSAITVVLPCFNMAETVVRAALSVIPQLGPHDRLIVIDDGSTDSSPTVLERLRHPALRVVHQQNRGVSAARNLGAGLAATRFVAFLDADDFWLAGAIDCLRSMIIRFPDSSLYAFGHFRVDPWGTSSSIAGSLGHTVEHLPGNEFISRYSRRDLVNSSTVCVPRRELEAIGGFPENVSVGEDVMVWLRLGLTGDVTVCLGKHALIQRPEPLYQRHRPGVPSYLAYIDDVLSEGKKERVQLEVLRRFLIKRGLKVFLGAKISGDSDLAENVRTLALRNRRWAAPLFLLGSVMHPTLLRLLYRINRRLK